MNINEEVMIRLAQCVNPRLTHAEATNFAREFRQKFLDVDDLMTSKDVDSMRKVVSKVDRLIWNLQSLMEDKELCHFFSAFSGGLSGVGLLAAANPLGATVFTVGLVASFLFGVGATVNAENIQQKIREIQRIIEADRKNFRQVAAAIRRLDDVFERYLRISLFSEESRQFLRSAAEHVVIEKYNVSSTNNEDRILQILQSLAIAQSLAQFCALISGCAALSSVSAMVPFLAAGLQTVLLIKDINENKDTIRKLSEAVADMKRKCDVLDVLY